MPDKPPTVHLVDDDPSVQRAIGRLLRTAGLNVDVYASAQQFLAAASIEQRGCVLLDVRMTGMDGMELQKRLPETGSLLPIIFLTGHGDIPMSVSAMKLGAVDFLTKPCSDAVLLDAINRALLLYESRRAEHAEDIALSDRMSTLTPREHEVMLLVVAGKSNKQIAAELGTVEKTIKVHRSRVMQKMQAGSLADLVRTASRARGA